MADEGYQVAGTFYPAPQTFRLVDPVLVTEITGMRFGDFAVALDDPSEQTNPIVVLGLIAVAVWQKNPRWRRDQVIRFLEQVDIDAVESVGGEGPDDAGPPEPASDVSSEAMPNDSDRQPDMSSEQLSPETPGGHGSDPGSPESLPT